MFDLTQRRKLMRVFHSHSRYSQLALEHPGGQYGEGPRRCYSKSRQIAEEIGGP